MKKTWKTILLQQMLYGGLEKQQYNVISPSIDEANRKTISILSIACALIYGIRLSMGFQNMPKANQIIFSFAVLIFVVIAAANHLVKKKRKLIHFSAYLFLATFLGSGILTSIGPGSIAERTTLYLVYIAMSAVFFALNALELTSIVAIAEIVFLVAITHYQAAYPVYAVNVRNSLFFSASGLALGIYLSNMKISGIYNAYMYSRMEEIKELNKELQESRRELQKALDQAEQANRAKTTFLNNMSHDIRTPMNAVLGFTELAQKHIGNIKQVEGYLQKIMTSGKHLLSLINDVLDMSRIESGKVTIEKKPVMLQALLTDVCTIIQPGADAKNIEFSAEFTNLVDRPILADKLRINQVLINILNNAVKFTPAGGRVSFRVFENKFLNSENSEGRTSTNSPLEHSTSTESHVECTFQIQDTGIGMSKEFQQHIFEAFSRAQSSTVSKIEGTGLGMAITKNIVDLMGGSINVESEEGKGTTFTVKLPFPLCEASNNFNQLDSTEQTVTSCVAIQSDEEIFVGKRILLAEDNELNQEIAQELLQDMGFVVTTVDNGAEAVEKMSQKQEKAFDLILMDIQMPVMDGYEAARAIRALADPTCASIPIIAMTANAFEEDRKAAFKVGMDGYLAKPVEISKMRELFLHILGSKK